MRSYTSTVGSEIIVDLRNRSDYSFQQLCEEVLRTVFPSVRSTCARRERDRGGIDQCVLIDDQDKFAAVFQCKGFEKLELGTDQIRQCLDSVEAFKSSGFRTDDYFLIVNRIVKGENRKKLENAVRELVESGVCEHARVLDVEAFLELVFEKAKKEVKGLLTESLVRYRKQHKERMEEDAYIEDVPFERENSSKPEANPLRFLNERVVTLALQTNNKRSWTFIVGEFGFGKTSLALHIPEALSPRGLTCLYFPVAQFPSLAFEGEMHFMWTALQLIREDEVSRTFLRDRIQHAVLKEILKVEKRIILLFDGLDEHPTCWRETGLKAVFGVFKSFNATCVFTMREEFLAERSGYFEAALKGCPGAFVLRLREWNEPQVLEYTGLWKLQHCCAGHDRIEHFESAVRTGKYMEFYGDIPKRPLFLKMLLIDVEKEDIRQRNLAEIYTSYLINKFRIDRETSTGDPVVTRPLGLNEDYTVICAYLFDIMGYAAGKMYQIEAGEVRMTPNIEEETLRSYVATKAHASLTLPAILSNSVLIPTRRRSMGQPMLTFTFAHKSFQSFFFAHHVLRILKSFVGDVEVLRAFLPTEVTRFVRGLYSIESEDVQRHLQERLRDIRGDITIVTRNNPAY